LSEPKSKQKNAQFVHQFVVLNHTLFSNIAALASTISAHSQRIYPEAIKQSAHKALNCLYTQLKKLDPASKISLPESTPAVTIQETRTMSLEEAQLKDQLEFIYRLCNDIGKVTTTLISR
ncbi:MAG: hypothetical protein ICV53_22965, partial [Flavisolibacter sp.]|nr:hypothetical protein [Flavisolibacter sp.]